jgi:hypothetical protein
MTLFGSEEKERHIHFKKCLPPGALKSPYKRGFDEGCFPPESCKVGTAADAGANPAGLTVNQHFPRNWENRKIHRRFRAPIRIGNSKAEQIFDPEKADARR